MSWPKVTVVECPKGGHTMVLEDGFCEHCAEGDMEREGELRLHHPHVLGNRHPNIEALTPDEHWRRHQT